MLARYSVSGHSPGGRPASLICNRQTTISPIFRGCCCRCCRKSTLLLPKWNRVNFGGLAWP